ncbi:hypothetical protein TWF281_006357 [Arthrobotrys megalospora]
MPKQPWKKRHSHYCLVEFGSLEETQAVITTLNNHPMRGRPVKIGVGDIKPRHPLQNLPRTGDDVDADISNLIQTAKFNAARKNPAKDKQECTRLWVSGLPHATNINQLEDFIRELFHGFHIESMSGVFEGKRVDVGEESRNCYCFVDLPNVTEAGTAVRILNNRETSWGIARVDYAPGGPQGPLEYRGVNDNNLPSGKK